MQKLKKQVRLWWKIWPACWRILHCQLLTDRYCVIWKHKKVTEIKIFRFGRNLRKNIHVTQFSEISVCILKSGLTMNWYHYGNSFSCISNTHGVDNNIFTYLAQSLIHKTKILRINLSNVKGPKFLSRPYPPLFFQLDMMLKKSFIMNI